MLARLLPPFSRRLRIRRLLPLVTQWQLPAPIRRYLSSEASTINPTGGISSTPLRNLTKVVVVALDASTENNIAKICLKLAAQGVLKEDFNTNTPIRGVTGPTPLGLDKLIKDTYIAFDISSKLRASTNIDDRKRNPIFAIQGSPGTGKTFFMNTLLRDSAESCPSELKPIMTKALRLGITFNSASARDSSHSVVSSIAARIMHAYLIGDTYYAMLPVIHKYLIQYNISLQQVIAFIVDKHGGLLLCVDEIVKIGNTEDIIALLTNIGGIRDDIPNFYAVLSTLNAAVVNNFTPGRSIYWLQLPRPSIESIMKLFVVKDKQWRNSNVLRCLVAMCGGHWRSLESLINIVKDSIQFGIASDSTFPDPGFSDCGFVDPMTEASLYAEMLASLRNDTIPYTRFDAIPHQLVTAALSGREVPYLTMFGAHTFDEHCAFGNLVNTFLTGPFIIPRSFDTFRDHITWPITKLPQIPVMSPLTLFHWSKKNLRTYPALCECILSLMPSLALTSTLFESYHGRWEELQHLIHAGQRMSMIDYYSRTICEEEQLPTHSLTNPDCCYLIEQKQFVWGGKQEFETLWRENKISVSQVALLGGNNRGFEVFLCNRADEHASYVPVFIDTHVSPVPKQPREMDMKLRLTLHVIQNSIQQIPVQDMPLDTTQAIHVFIEASKDPNSASVALSPGQSNCILISAALWRHLLGPTLAYCVDLNHKSGND